MFADFTAKLFSLLSKGPLTEEDIAQGSVPREEPGSRVGLEARHGDRVRRREAEKGQFATNWADKAGCAEGNHLRTVALTPPLAPDATLANALVCTTAP
jgi:hypothetical protein